MKICLVGLLAASMVVGCGGDAPSSKIDPVQKSKNNVETLTPIQRAYTPEDFFGKYVLEKHSFSPREGADPTFSWDADGMRRHSDKPSSSVPPLWYSSALGASSLDGRGVLEIEATAKSLDFTWKPFSGTPIIAPAMIDSSRSFVGPSSYFNLYAQFEHLPKSEFMLTLFPCSVGESTSRYTAKCVAESGIDIGSFRKIE